MGLTNVRMSRKEHAMPVMFKGGTGDHRAASTYSDGQRPAQPEKPKSVHSTVPKKVWPETIAPWTPPPTSYARSTGVSGKDRDRQARKSSRSK